ncbi:MAG: hypothetical protein N2258_00935 [Brevinematales bacterium]|nr:hypothetical protein [Brevinematales bacterium]
MNSFNVWFRVFSVSFFAICVIFFVGEQRLESRNYEMEIKKLEREISELEEYKQKLILEYNNEYQNFVRQSIDTTARPISLKDVKIIEIVKPTSSSKEAENKEQNISDFEKFINLLKSKIG